MNAMQRRELADDIQDLSDQIEALTGELAAKMKECDDISYTAAVVETNIYKMLGVKGYYNMSSDVSGAIEYLEDDGNFEDGDTADENEPETDEENNDNKPESQPEATTDLNTSQDKIDLRYAKEAALVELRKGKRIAAIIAYRKHYHISLKDAKIAVEYLQVKHGL